ncbi:MAG: hypothetical protein FWC80_00170 [Firmicutes bacterium]|nr:hypothetical protein [Bacillota bacterium]
MKKTKVSYLSLLVLIPMIVIGVFLATGTAEENLSVLAQAPSARQETVTIYFYNNLNLLNPRVQVVGESGHIVMTQDAPDSNWFFADVVGDLESGILIVFSGSDGITSVNGFVTDDGLRYFSNAGKFSDRATAEIISTVAAPSSNAPIVWVIVLTVLGLLMIIGAVIVFLFVGKKKRVQSNEG